MKLHECLANTPYRDLMVIARLRHVDPGLRPRKAQLVHRLAAALLDPAGLRQTLESLSPAECQALDALIAAGGRLPWDRFRQRFGDIRPYKPWRTDQPRHPWRDPASPAERLAYLGLIFRHPRHPRSGDSGEVLIPEDLLDRLPPVPPPAMAARREPLSLPQPPPVGDLLQDVALFLSLLHRWDVHPLHGRWLPPRYLHDLNQRLSWPEDLTAVRSELQTGRLRFLHFLAESASLIHLVASRLTPTPQAWTWLDAPRDRRYAHLWCAWQAPTDAQRLLWRRYRFPGAELADPLSPVARLLDHLAQCSPEDAFGLTAFTRALLDNDPSLWDLTPWWEQDAGRDRAREIIHGLMAGPLRWWGIITLHETGGEQVFTITPLGCWLLHGTGDPPSDPDTLFMLEDDLTITVPSGVPPRALVRLEVVTEWVERSGDALRYRLTPASLARALGRGISPEEIMALLDRGASNGLTPAQRAHLETWADETRAVRLQWVTLLEARTAEQMAHLTQDRRVRSHIRRTLSPRAAVVDERGIKDLLRALHRLGIPVQGSPPLSREGDVNPPAPDTGAAAHLLIAGRVYAALSRWIDLPQPLPIALLDDLAAQLDPRAITAAHQAADDVLDALAQAMDGWTPRPMPGGGLPLEKTVPVIEDAIRNGHSLDMAYWTAGRGELSRRTVDPYCLEWRGNVPYLIGYCHERQAERVFRVDRIQSLELPTSRSAADVNGGRDA